MDPSIVRPYAANELAKEPTPKHTHTDPYNKGPVCTLCTVTP